QTRAVGAPGDLGVGFNAFVGGPGDTRGAQESAATDAVGHGQTIDPALQINAAIGFFRVFLANLDHALLSSISQTKLLIRQSTTLALRSLHHHHSHSPRAPVIAGAPRRTRPSTGSDRRDRR